jgi:predicted Zn-ribbon and HTH transcriptional regulator
MNKSILVPLKCFDCGLEWSTELSNDNIPHCPGCGSDDVLDPVTTDIQSESSAELLKK